LLKDMLANWLYHLFEFTKSRFVEGRYLKTRFPRSAPVAINFMVLRGSLPGGRCIWRFDYIYKIQMRRSGMNWQVRQWDTIPVKNSLTFICWEQIKNICVQRNVEQS
jgi:hypothetical protein